MIENLEVINTVVEAVVEAAAGGAAGGDEEAAKPIFIQLDALVWLVSVFVLAVFVGFEVITKVPRTLHTPLMSGSNAISGITIVGALIAFNAANTGAATIIGIAALVLATINVVGGFLVTHRMLAMFKTGSQK